MLTRKQQELLTFIDQRLQADGVSPSFEEMKDALQLRSKSGVHRLINALEERRFIRRLPNRARALEVLQMPEALRPILTLVPPAPAPRPHVQSMIAANDTIIVPLPLVCRWKHWKVIVRCRCRPRCLARGIITRSKFRVIR